MRRSADDLVSELARDVEPVRALAPLHRQLLAVAGIWAASALAVAGWLGLHPLAALERGAASAAVAWALALVGFAGLTLGLGCRIPGRERLALGAAGGVALGGLAVVAVGLLLPGSIAEAGSLSQCAVCVGRSLLLAIPSGSLALVLALRAAPWRPRVAGLGLAVGGTALGALLVHWSCPSPSPWHGLVAHALLPLASGVPLGLLAAWALERLDR
jgi:hypothetical protein